MLRGWSEREEDLGSSVTAKGQRREEDWTEGREAGLWNGEGRAGSEALS